LRAVPTWNSSALADLGDRTQYEAWLLEAVYATLDQALHPFDSDSFIYPPGGRPPSRIALGAGTITIGDWRPQFLEVGAPLVFITSFKLLDMFLEWVLVQNGVAATFRFSEKVRHLTHVPAFPPAVDKHPWLRDRLIALYTHSEPLRGTIIHDRHFTAQGGMLNVSSSRIGKAQTSAVLNPSHLRNFAFAIVSVVRCVQGAWAIDVPREKQLRYVLDQLSALHTLPPLGQRRPMLANVRVYAWDHDPVECDLEAIRKDASVHFRDEDPLFNLRIVTVAHDGGRAQAYLIPWDTLEQFGPTLRKTRGQLSQYAVSVPSDVNPNTIAGSMTPHL
jgi:hypothetical protein